MYSPTVWRAWILPAGAYRSWPQPVRLTLVTRSSPKTATGTEPVDDPRRRASQLACARDARTLARTASGVTSSARSISTASAAHVEHAQQQVVGLDQASAGFSRRPLQASPPAGASSAIRTHRAGRAPGPRGQRLPRSEEHTSELQSRENL